MHSLPLLLFCIVGFSFASNNPTQVIPKFLNAVLPNKDSSWTTNCFYVNATLTELADSAALNLIGQYHNSSKPHCSDLYLILTPFSFYLHQLSSQSPITFYFADWKAGEKTFVDEQGYQVFLLQDGYVDTLFEVAKLYKVFTTSEDPGFVMPFLASTAGFKFEKRQHMFDFSLFNTSYVTDGFYIAAMDLGGGESSLIALGTGSRADHAALAMWEDDVLYVFESCLHGIRKTPWEHWFSTHPYQNYAVWPLAPEIQARFNKTAALARFKELEGLPYGWQVFSTCWIDTKFQNYPPPLSAQIVPTAIALADKIAPQSAHDDFLEPLNKRLGTTGKSIDEILSILDSQGSTIWDLIAIPENDDWLYNGHPARVCSTFVADIYKAAGVFGDLDFHVTEQTPKDSYQWKVFDENWDMPDICKQDGFPYCQLSGEYKFFLPGQNTIHPYENMNSHCGALPPQYQRVPVEKC